MTSEPVMALALGVGLGLASGLIHFGGLWATLRALPRLARPRLVFWTSWLARTACALAGFRLALFLGAPDMGAPALGAAVAGFLAARTLLIRRMALGEAR